jgi:hypothetical protein
MPTKQELETINDELLAENDQLRRERSEQAQQLAALTEALQGVTARLDAFANRPPASAPSSQNASSRDELAAQIEPLVAGLKQMLDRAKMEAIDQNKRAQILQTMLERNERTNYEFMDSLNVVKVQTLTLRDYLHEWSGQPRLTVLKVTGAMFFSTILAGLLIAFLVSWSLSPTRTLIEDATKWQVLTEEMPPEQIREWEQRIENKLYRRQQDAQTEGQTSGANTPTTTPDSTPMISSPTPPADRRNRR